MACYYLGMIAIVVKKLIERNGENIEDVDKKLRLNGELNGAITSGVFTQEMLIRLSEYFGIDLTKIRRLIR